MDDEYGDNRKYSLNFIHSQNFLFKENIKLHQAKFTDKNTLQLYSFFDGILNCYHQDDVGTWHTYSMKNDILSNTLDIYFADILKTGQQLLITKNNEGINFVQYKENQLYLLNQDETLHELYGWSNPNNFIKFGHFYTDTNMLGILTKHYEYGLQFYGVMKNEIFPEGTPIWTLETNLNMIEQFLDIHTNFYIADLNSNGQDDIIVQTSKGLIVYNFNTKNQLKQEITILCCNKIDNLNDKLYFSNVTGQQYQDIIYFNSTGLYLHTYNPILKIYRFLSYHPLFSLEKGWTSDNTDTVKFLDVNYDGREDMVFTGQQGITILSYNNYNNRWLSLLDNTQISIQVRNGKVIDIISYSDKLTMFIYFENRMHMAKIEELIISKQNHTTTTNYHKNPTSQVIKPHVLLQESSLVDDIHTVFLRDQLDYSSIMVDSVDRSSGRVKFMLPLVDIPNIAIKFKIFYDGVTSGILGTGWSFPQNFIIFDHQSSIFFEDSKYYIVYQQALQELVYESKNSTTNLYYFRLQNPYPDEKAAEMKISYFRNQERWEISTNLMTQVYGKVNEFQTDPIQWELTWKNWRGAGTSKKDQIQLVSGWYLSEVRDKQNNVLYYSYNSVNCAISRDDCTENEIYLKQIADGEGNKITFKYNETNDSIGKDKPHSRLKTRLYLSGYILSTVKYTQDIDFTYTIRDNQRMFSAVVQKNDQPALQFRYNEGDLLEEIIFPFGAQIKYIYQNLGSLLANKKKFEHRILINSNYKVHYGNGYILISCLNNNGKIELRLFDQNMSKELYSSSSLSVDNRLPLLGKSSIKSYEISADSSYISIILWYSNDKEIYLFHWQGDKLMKSPTMFNFSEESIIKFGVDFIIAADRNTSPLIIEWNKVTQRWTKTAFHAEKNWKNTTIAAFGRMFVVYDDEVIEVGYRNLQQYWMFKIIKRIPNLISNIQQSLNRFHLEDELYKQLFYYSKNTMLHIMYNIVLLSNWSSEGTQIYSNVYLFLLNNNYEIILEKHQKIRQDNINDISEEFMDDKGNSFKCKYSLQNNKFVVQVIDYKGPQFDEIENIKRKAIKEIDAASNVGYRKSTTELKNQINIDATAVHEKNKKIIAELLGKKLFLLDYAKYHGSLNSNVAIISDFKFNFTGTEWEVENNSVQKTPLLPLSLGNNYIFDQENVHSSFKLYRQNSEGKKQVSCFYDLQVKYLNETVIKYPVYLAYQSPGREAQVIEFSKKGEISKTYSLPFGEQLSLWSGYQGIITEIRDSNSNKLTYLIFRPILGIRDLSFNSVITQSVLSYDGNMKRMTGYDYNVSNATTIDQGNFYLVNTVIPGNDRKSFGWIEETIHENFTTKVVYNGQGDIIRTWNEKFIDERDDLESAVDKNTTLFDKMNKLPIARFFPYDITSGIVGYYGFEDYEENKRSDKTGSKIWIYNQTNVVRGKFSFTGRNYLHINSGEILEGTFYLKNENMSFVASTWIRPEFELPQLGSNTPYLKIEIRDEVNQRGTGVFSEIKLQSSGWYYMEAIINLYYFKFQIDDTEYNGTNTANKSELQLKVSVIISPEVNSSIDVDHIRFSPLNCRYQAHVYNPVTKYITHEIQYNGLIRRYVYDKYQEKIATINEYGQLTKFNTYYKVSSIGAEQQPRSNILIEAENGFYEDFSPDNFSEHWKIQATHGDIQISPGQLKHISQAMHVIQLLKYNIDDKSYGIRVYYNLQSDRSYIQFNRVIKLIRSKEVANLYLANTVQAIPLQGEILILLEGNHLFVWVEGGLYIDTEIPSFHFQHDVDSLVDLEMEGELTLSEVMVFNRANVVVTYYNGLGEKDQEIKLEDGNNVIVTAYLYDELGRQSITTKPKRITKSNTTRIIAYYPDFIINDNPHSENSVWKSGKLKWGNIGRHSSIIGEYEYTQTTYQNNPLDEERMVGLPGKEFSVNGRFSKRFDSTTNIIFVMLHYPVSEGYKYRIENKPGDIKDIVVFDSEDNKVAWYLHVPNNKDLLCTYEYDGNNRLVKLLPPLYHERAGTFYNLQHQKMTNGEMVLEKSLGTHIVYDDNGNIRTKTTPDTGKIENIYDQYGLLKFVVYYCHQNDKRVDNVLYFNYDGLYRLVSTGQLKSPPSIAQLLHTIHNNTKTYQEFYYNDADPEPVLRGRIRRTITYNHNQPFIEEILLNEQKDTIKKRITIPIEKDKPLYVDINTHYAGDKIIMLQYPVEFQGEPFILTYEYNKMGKIKEIGVPGNSSVFCSFTYNPSGQVVSETHYPASAQNFTRHYLYNSPGFLINLKDKFLSEDLFYTEAGYGGYGYGDGTITRTEFKATWHKYSTRKGMGLNERSFLSQSINSKESKHCFNKLKQSGYIDDMNHQLKVFYPELEVGFPIVCSQGVTGRYIANILGKRGFPTHYGHVYDYGNHQELTKAKYFVGGEYPRPLQPDIFATKIPALENSTASHKIWQVLKGSRFLIEDQDKVNLSNAHGKRGQSFIRPSLAGDLRNIDPDYRKYLLNISKLLGTNFSKKHLLSFSEFLQIFSDWRGSNLDERDKKEAHEIYNMLQRNNYLQNPLSAEFWNALKEFDSNIIYDIVKVLLEHFAQELGEAEFDVESYGIDANGNHKHYYTGFDRYEISYLNNTNKVDSLIFRSHASSNAVQSYRMEHDSRGNVVQALHKGINRIHYDAVLNRASEIELLDGRIIKLFYDSQGERILKRVMNGEGRITREVHYIRDASGRSLVERELSFISPDQAPAPLVTVYIYGPRGLIGFIRRDVFYSVITDHEQSVRLVVKSGEVVAAYDYLPYGNLMREFASYPEAQIAYRYTGQEWDEELGLYNFHARFYDPNIGRFFQVDPKEQYYSPYLYAGNSPISTIDPDGEFAFIIAMIIGTAVGAYLGSASANKTFNVSKWNWKSGKTWLGLIGGGIGGALSPVGFGASVSAFRALGMSTFRAYSATFGLGLAGAYLSTGSRTGQWDPSKWDFSSSETWNALFTGFNTGSGMLGGFQSARQFYKSLTTTGKGLFIGGTAISGAGLLYMHGSAANWDFSKPEMWFGLLEVISSAPDLPMFLRGASRFAAKNVRVTTQNLKKIVKFISQEKNLISHFSHMKSEWNQFGRAITKISSGSMVLGLSMYLVGSAVNEDFKKWDMTSVGTYQALIYGLMTGGQLSSVVKNKYRIYRLNKKMVEGKKALKAVDYVAKKTVEEYEHILDAINVKLNVKKKSDVPTYKRYEKLVEIVDVKKYSIKSRNRITQGKIPNTALAVGISDNLIISAFSLNEAPGLVMVFPHRKLNSATYTVAQPYKKFLEINLEIAGKPVALSDNSARNTYLMNSILETQEGIKQHNIKKFESKVSTLRQVLGELEGIGAASRENILENLRNIFYENGYLKGGRKTIINELENQFNNFIKTKIRERKNHVKNEMLDIESKLNNPDLSKEIKEDLRKKYEVLKKVIGAKDQEVDKAKQEFIGKRDNIVENMWTLFEDFEKQLTLWAPINCAEPHVISVFSRRREIMEDSSGTFYDKSGDIKFLATFNIKGEKFVSFERCDHCKISTAHVKNVITDPQWTEILNGLLLKRTIESKLKPSIDRLYFLIPLGMINKGLTKNNTDIRRRSVRQVTKSDESLISQQRTAGEELHFSPVVASTAVKNHFYISKLFHWLKEQCNIWLGNTGRQSGFNEESKLPRNVDNLFYRTDRTNRMLTDIVDVQGSLLLANVFVAKKFNRQVYSTDKSESISYTEALAIGMNICETFENEMMRAAIKYGLAEYSLNMDFVEIQNAIISHILANKLYAISAMLITYAEEAYPINELAPSQLADRQKLIYRMDNHVNKFVNKTIEQLLVCRQTKLIQNVVYCQETGKSETNHSTIGSQVPAYQITN